MIETLNTSDGKLVTINFDHVAFARAESTNRVFVSFVGGSSVILDHDPVSFAEKMGALNAAPLPRSYQHPWGPWRLTHDRNSLVSIDPATNQPDRTFTLNAKDGFMSATSYAMELNHADRFSFAHMEATAAIAGGNDFPGHYYHPEKP